MTDDKGQAADYIKAHAKRVADVMTANVITATAQTPLSELAMILEQNAIKRVPIVHDGQIVGIVSRANLVQAVAASGSKLDIPPSDVRIRDKLLAGLKTQRWLLTDLFNATVNDGIVDLWGIAGSESERKAIRITAEAISGLRAVNDRMIVVRFSSRGIDLLRQPPSK
jgi:predicted transcriptional regulator